MPVIKDQGAESPRRRNLSRSPDPDIPGFEAGPSTKKARVTTTDIQARRLEKLFAHPERDPLPQEPVAPKERQFKQNLEIIKNMTASAAAAGSGEFHVYKHGRRKEYERIRKMEQNTRDLEEQAAFIARQQARDAEAEAKTSKNRAKRLKRKAGRKGGAAGDSGSANGNGNANGEGNVKRKLAGGGGVVFKKPGEESDEEEENEAVEDKETDPRHGLDVPVPPSVAQHIPAQEPPAAMKVEERDIIIHDDE